MGDVRTLPVRRSLATDNPPVQEIYYLIFPPTTDSPPQITDSFDAAQRWKALGCFVETHIRSGATRLQ